jgi:hypothetical protein
MMEKRGFASIPATHWVALFQDLSNQPHVAEWVHDSALQHAPDLGGPKVLCVCSVTGLLEAAPAVTARRCTASGSSTKSSILTLVNPALDYVCRKGAIPWRGRIEHHESRGPRHHPRRRRGGQSTFASKAVL